MTPWRPGDDAGRTAARRAGRRHLLLLGLAAGPALVLGCGAPAAEEQPEGTLAVVTRVVDGDTIHVEAGGEELRVRLLNIDAPETEGPYTEAECHGETSAEYLAALLPAGTEVRLVSDEEPQDRYGRHLAGVYLEDLLVNEELAREGMAEPVLVEPNSRFYEAVVAASEEARAAGRGIFDPAEICRP